MRSTTRRAFLKLSALSLPALTAGPALPADTNRALAAMQAAMQPTYRTPATISRFIDPLPIPHRQVPAQVLKDKTIYRIAMREARQQLHSQLPPTTIWGFEGTYPGPTIEAVRGVPITVEWENHLPTRHLFAVDPRIHGAMPPTPAVRTVTHLHGARTDSESDGLPERWFVPGSVAHYNYPNNQAAASLWYHDHAVGITRLNVYAGLSGFYLLRDAEELAMQLPSGKYEIPLLVQDRSLDDAGQLVYSPTNEDGAKLPPGVWGPEFFGDLPLVNGALYPYLDVEPRPYRLRLLNGANSRFFNFYFNLAKHATDVPALVNFHQIGSDGGFLPQPVSLSKLLLGPAERADLIIDFSGLEGRTVTLSNNGAAPFPGWEMMTMHHAGLNELMQFRVVLPKASDARPVNIGASATFTKLEADTATIARDLVLTETLDAQGRSLGVRINNKGYDDPVTETVKSGAVETWRFINTTDDAHPMHLHLVQFQIVHRQGFDATAYRAGTLKLVGSPRPPAANEAGWKDTALVYPREVLTIIARFEGFTGRYVYHCHMLEHEDNDMMRPFEVVA